MAEAGEGDGGRSHLRRVHVVGLSEGGRESVCVRERACVCKREGWVGLYGWRVPSPRLTIVFLPPLFTTHPQQLTLAAIAAQRPSTNPGGGCTPIIETAQSVLARS